MANKRVDWERMLPNMVKDDEGISGMPGGPILYRCKIPGGWLVSTGKGEGSGMAYVPDPNHSWGQDQK